MKSAKSQRRRARKRGSENQSAFHPTVHPNAAGIDIGAEELVAAIPPERAPGASVRTFSSFTSGVCELRDWLVAQGITTVAMESTGNYWITAYNVLESAGIEVFLVNARHVKGVPGKKTDVCDAQWLQQLHAAGLLKKSFRPTQAIVPLRYLMRHRESLVEDSAQQVQMMQKVLTEMNLKLQHVFSDLDGASAQAIIDAILAGERDPRQLARLRDRRCRSAEADILAALQGDYREEYLFVLRQCQQTWRQRQVALRDCDVQITAVAAKVKGCAETPRPPTPLCPRRQGKNSVPATIFEQSWQFYGVDLSTAPGVGAHVVSLLMSEIGPREDLLRCFRSAEAFCSWQGLCPDNRISGGKVLKAKTRKVPNRLARALRLGMLSVQRGDHQMGHYCRRIKGRLGKAEGQTAAAHKLARILYGMILHQQPYDETTAFKTSPASAARHRKNLAKQAAALGLQLVPMA